MTKREMYTTILGLNDVQASPELSAFVEHELELLDKKNKTTGKKSATPRQKENVVLCAAIYDAMESGKQYTVTDLCDIVDDPDATQSRVSSLMRQMDDQPHGDKHGDGRVIRVKEKRKTYFVKNDNWTAPVETETEEG